MSRGKKILVALLGAILAAGCSRPVLREFAQPSRTKDQYTRIKRVAVLPFENYSDTKDAEKTIDALLPTALLEEGVFSEVEDVRFVRDLMRKLKITATDILDKEVVKKLSDEMNVQAIIYGKIISFGKGKDKDAASQVTMDMVMLDPVTSNILWLGNVSAHGGLTVGKVFGVTEGKTDIAVAREAVRRLASSLAEEVEDGRERERKGLLAEIRKEEEKERARLEQLKSQTGKIQEQLDKAKTEAEQIRQQASQEAEALKADIELQKAAVEAEKSRTEAAQQQIDQEKLRIEMEQKKIEEERARLEEERRAAEKAIREEPVQDSAPVPESPPAIEPSAEQSSPDALEILVPEETPPAESPPAPEAPAAPAETAPPPAPAQQ